MRHYAAALTLAATAALASPADADGRLTACAFDGRTDMRGQPDRWSYAVARDGGRIAMVVVRIPGRGADAVEFKPHPRLPSVSLALNGPQGGVAPTRSTLWTAEAKPNGEVVVETWFLQAGPPERLDYVLTRLRCPAGTG